MKKIAIFASGSGSNFQAIVDAVNVGKLSAEVVLLVCDKPEAKVIERGKKHGIDVFSFSPKCYDRKELYEREILHKLQEKQVELIVLAGYMRLIGETLLHAFQGKIINIHPSLLPSFMGKDAIGQALNYGVKVTGVTVHFVDEGMDTGEIIAQEPIVLATDETLETLTKKIHQVEHQLYTATIEKLLEGK